MQNKRCPKCGEEKPLTKEFWCADKRTNSGLATGACRNCKREYNREYLREYQREYNREYQRSDAYREYIRRRCRSDAYREYHREYVKVSDYYVRNKLSRQGIAPEAITPELIDLKRQQLSMKRTLKQFKTWRKEHESNHADV